MAKQKLLTLTQRILGGYRYHEIDTGHWAVKTPEGNLYWVYPPMDRCSCPAGASSQNCKHRKDVELLLKSRMDSTETDTLIERAMM
tara:strand:+ start:552 stop:809 length:258 start_codon:yes stop_codon:yes gene_type:complete